MRRRLYFLVPGVETARHTMNDLLLAQVDARNVHVLAQRGTNLEGLHEASILQKTDIVHGMETGLAVGGGAGILAGLVAVLFPPAGVSLELVTILVTALLGAAFGAWASSMVASSIPNSRLKTYETAIERGEILMMVDVPMRRVDEIRKLVANRHPEAIGTGMEPTIPAFP